MLDPVSQEGAASRVGTVVVGQQHAPGRLHGRACRLGHQRLRSIIVIMKTCAFVMLRS